jgi:hypothetical protein
MTAKLRQLKTVKDKEKGEMLEFLEYLRAQIEQDQVQSLICIVDHTDSTEPVLIPIVFGDMNCFQAMGMLESAKLSYQMSILDEEF